MATIVEILSGILGNLDIAPKETADEGQEVGVTFRNLGTRFPNEFVQGELLGK